MLDDMIKDAEQRMQKSIETLKRDLAKIRTGRAHPSVLDHVTVEYYGSETSLSQVANISTSDARTLAITPWDKSMVGPVEKAIMNSDLGLNPSTAGDVIRIKMPALTEDRRRELVRVVRNEAEGGRIAIRNIRRDVNQDLKDLLKEKEITEDDLRRGEERVQKTTDRYVAQIDDLLKEKEQDLMAL